MDIEAVGRVIEGHSVRTVKIGGADLDGVYRGKRVSAEQFLAAAAGGFPQCDVVFGWDIQDEVIGSLPYSNWDIGFGDVIMRPDLDTFAVCPWEEGSASVICDFYTEHGEPLPIAPRSVLKRVLAQAEAAGFRAQMAAELEVRFFREDQESLREKGYHGLRPLSPGLNCYSIHHASLDEPVIGYVCRMLNEYGIPVEAYNREHGAGMYEINLRYTDALAAADRAMLYKSAAKEISGQMGVTPTFMAKYADDVDGCGGHLHQSLWSAGGQESVFWDASRPHGMSETLERYAAGLLATLPEFMLMYAPNVNSYKRYVRGTWAPTNLTWGLDNRTVALRVITGSPGAIRIENRVPGADLNPYLAFAASVAGGLYGIEERLAPPPMVKGSAYKAADADLLPQALPEALERFRGSELARRCFGDEFVDQYVAFREWEVEKARRAVTDWERRRYFEMV
ncbi:MAG: glutamine synthetase family protein [Dehalococcoidia bacterium]|nr:glutamine synthetase family protein [Dehalococcoidia bacterium]